MTPKEKAIDLFNEYFDLVEAYSAEQQHENARTAALIAVHLILSEFYADDFYADDFYVEVKQELKKI